MQPSRQDPGHMLGTGILEEALEAAGGKMRLCGS
jgi:hypothetical protein